MNARDVALVALFATLTAIGAFIQIPFVPVPLTLQTLFVLLSGLILGKRLGAMSQICYLSMGAIGLPVFAGGTSGLGIITGPTGGYLVGFVVASFVVGALTEKKVDLKKDIIAMGIGTAVIYVFGIAQLMNFLGIGLYSAMKLGMIPFLPGDLVKVVLAISIAQKVKKSGVLMNI